MSTIIPEQKFTKKLLQKQFNDLYFKYITRDRCVLLFDSIVTICNENRVKVIEYIAEPLGYIGNQTIDVGRFLEVVSEYEWDYDFVSYDILRVTITSSFWYDVYFSESLPEQVQDKYFELLEDDVLNNYRRMDDYILSSRLMFDEMAEMQERFYTDYGEELLPSFLDR